MSVLVLERINVLYIYNFPSIFLCIHKHTVQLRNIDFNILKIMNTYKVKNQ